MTNDLRTPTTLLLVALLASCKAVVPQENDQCGIPTCMGSVAEVEATCMCQTFSDCEGGTEATWACSNGHKCIETCTTSADCQNPSEPVCFESICVSGACDCEGNPAEQCVGSSCNSAFTAANVATCEVVPPAALLNAGGSKDFWVVSKDWNGNEIDYEGAVTWGVSGVPGATASVSTTSTATAKVSGSTDAGTGAVTATIGSTTCAPARLTAFAEAAPGTLRVTVADQWTGAVITDATVIDGAGATLLSGGDGTYSETNPNPTGRNSVSVFESGYTYVTVVDTSSTDLFIPLLPIVAPVGIFQGTQTNTDFNNLSIPTGTVHVALSGASIAGNLVDLSLPGLLGGPVPTMINLGGATATTQDLPDGLTLGLGPTMFKGSYSVSSPPGVRALWTLGGNITLQVVLNAVSGSPDTAGILTSLFPVLGELESGITGGVEVAPGEQGSLTTTGNTSGTNARLAPETLMRLHLAATVPHLPAYYLPTDTPGMPTGQLNGALVVGGVLARPQGFVPLGLTAGVIDTAGNNPTQIAGFMGGPDGVMPINLAPRSGGLEGAPFLAVALATDLPQLGSTLTGSATTPLILSGNVILPGAIPFDGATAMPVTFPGTGGTFLGFPVQPKLSATTRTLSLPATDVSGVALHTLVLTSDTAAWKIYFPAGETAVQIPSLPTTFAGADVLATPSSVALQSVTLNLDPSRTYTFDDVLSFQSAGVTVDDLTLQIDQFSVESVPLQN